MVRYLYSELASAVQARLNCKHTGNEKWFGRWTDHSEKLVRKHMPSGSGFDNGTRIDLDRSHGERLVFHTSFHHMNESGMYDGWTEHTVTVTPSFHDGFRLRIGGRNRADIKDYIEGEFCAALTVQVGTIGDNGGDN